MTAPPWRDAIDVHHHVVPDFYADALAELGYATSLPGVEPPKWSPEISLDMMDRQGIRSAVVNVWPGVPAVPDAAVAAALARRINDYLAELVALAPDRFGAFAVLPLPHVDASLAELSRALDGLGLDGVGAVTNVGGTYIGEPVLDPVLAELAHRGAPMFVHPTMSPAQGQPMFGLPGSLCEFPFETVRTAVALLYNQTLERHPGLRVILSHGGGGVPYLAERLTYGPIIDGRLSSRLGADPIGSLRRIYVDIAMTGNRYAVPSLTELLPDDHVLMGSDYPFMPEWSGEQNSHGFLEHHPRGDAVRDAVARSNALPLFPRLARAADSENVRSSRDSS